MKPLRVVKRELKDKRLPAKMSLKCCGRVWSAPGIPHEDPKEEK
jgi:hypothetical protein